MNLRKKFVFILCIFVSTLSITARSQDLSFAFTEQKIIFNTVEVSKDSALSAFIRLLGKADKTIKEVYKDSARIKHNSIKHFYNNLGIIISEDADKNEISYIEFWYEARKGKWYPKLSFKGKVSILGRDINQLISAEEIQKMFPEFKFANALGYCMFHKEDFEFIATIYPWSGLSMLRISLNQ